MFDDDVTLAAIMERDAQEISRNLRRRNVAFLQTLVEQYQYRLVRYLIYLTGRRDGVDDLVQETWLRVLERGGSYDAHSRFEPWLFRIARNLALDDLRKRPTVSLDSTQTGEWDSAAPSPISTAPSPFLLAARSEDAQRLAHSMQALDPACREALVLRFQEELSLQEISIVADAPVSTIASRIYRALAILRTELEERNHDL